MELMTSLRFFRMVGTLSPAEVLHLALAARAGGMTEFPSATHTRESVPPAGAGCVHGDRGEPGTVGRRVSAHETRLPSS